ncbi:DUF3105 domain-containing protein [Cellulomonas sp. ATA003]|uniref:DUF3105 domain-containing protein n=1 Tax=Cellulomonas sp. ATA003 TaxID=3073064 RepID=UPI002873372C|nr:DUF3105 domain-containing protein [Cellulomonas sp. ATA003]WNB86768.1 DUF3105 domain-containing protein [Cellulomonas sp. ATA003]
MSNRKAETAERKARIAAMQAAQRKAERRRTTIIAAVVGVIVLALVAVTLVIVLGQESENNAQEDAIERAAQQDIEGVEEFEGLGNSHVSTTVEYEQVPPVGGDHNAVWQNCGVYGEPVADENAVHSLEHGAVWITYDPTLPADQVEALEAKAASNNYVLVSPYEGVPTPVVASAWGLQLQLDDAADERLDVFLRKYVRGDQTPEPGAACSGGTGTPE